MLMCFFNNSRAHGRGERDRLPAERQVRHDQRGHAPGGRRTVHCLVYYSRLCVR